MNKLRSSLTLRFPYVAWICLETTIRGQKPPEIQRPSHRPILSLLLGWTWRPYTLSTCNLIFFLELCLTFIYFLAASRGILKITIRDLRIGSFLHFLSIVLTYSNVKLILMTKIHFCIQIKLQTSFLGHFCMYFLPYQHLQILIFIIEEIS